MPSSIYTAQFITSHVGLSSPRNDLIRTSVLASGHAKEHAQHRHLMIACTCDLHAARLRKLKVGLGTSERITKGCTRKRGRLWKVYKRFEVARSWRLKKSQVISVTPSEYTRTAKDMTWIIFADKASKSKTSILVSTR